MLGVLVGALIGESSEFPMYASCSKTIKFRALIQKLISYIAAYNIPHAHIGQMVANNPWCRPS
jgi:hypothetical protein